MEYSLKWWQYVVMGLFVLLNAASAVLGGGSYAAIYGRLTGSVVASIALVYALVIAGRALMNWKTHSSTTTQ